MTNFIYKGFYYPVIGNDTGWENYRTKTVIEKRFPSWDKYDKWYSFSYGVKCKLHDPDKPYRQKIVDTVKDHKEMEIVYQTFNDRGQDDPKGEHGMYSVKTLSDKYIGSIRDAYFITNLIHLKSHKDSNQICCGWNVKDQKAHGWSHRAMASFGKGDRVFDPEFGDDTTVFKDHGEKTIETFQDAIQSALNFAEYVS